MLCNSGSGTGASSLPIVGVTSSCCTYRSELDEYGHIQPVLAPSQIWRESRHRLSGIPIVATGRRDATSPREIRHARCPVIILPPESNVLAGHIVEGCGGVPCLVGVAGIFREVRRVNGCRSRRHAVDGRQKHQIPSTVVDLAAT